MPFRSNKKLLYIELRSGHNRHRFVRRHSSEQAPKRKADSQTKPTRLSWSLSVGAASTSEPPKTSKGRKRRSTKARGTSDTETECSKTCCCTEAVRVDDDCEAMVALQRSLGCPHSWCSATAAEPVYREERKQRRIHHHRCRCRPLQQQIYYQPLYDNLQIQNNYYEHRKQGSDCEHRDASKKADGVEHLLPGLEQLSLANGHGRTSPPPAYSEICPGSADTPFVGRGADLRFGSAPYVLEDGLEGFERVEQ